MGESVKLNETSKTNYFSTVNIIDQALYHFTIHEPTEMNIIFDAEKKQDLHSVKMKIMIIH